MDNRNNRLELMDLKPEWISDLNHAYNGEE